MKDARLQFATAEWIVAISPLGAFLKRSGAYEASALLVKAVFEELDDVEYEYQEQTIRTQLQRATDVISDSPTGKMLEERFAQENEIEYLRSYVDLVISFLRRLLMKFNW